MHGFNIENKGFKTLTDYVRVRYVPSASSKAYVGQKVKGVYWNGVKGWHAANVRVDGADYNLWMQCDDIGGNGFVGRIQDTGLRIFKRKTAGAICFSKTDDDWEGTEKYSKDWKGPWTVSIIEGTGDASSWAHTLYF